MTTAAQRGLAASVGTLAASRLDKTERLTRLVVALALAMVGCEGTTAQPPPDAAPPDDGRWHAALPFSRAEMLDESTLRPTIHDDRLEPSECAPGASNRVVEVTYFSHNWHDGEWFGTMTVLIPETIHRPGTMAMGDIESDWMDCTANRLGIVVASVPDSDEHFGLSEIHDVYEHILCEMMARNDIHWSPYWPFVALRMRAMTMAGALAGQSTQSAYTFGSSINGSLSYSTALYDTRVKGLGATGAYGHQDSFLAQPAAADLYYSWCITGCNPYAMAADLRAELLATADLHIIGPSLDIPVLQVVPTNDVNATHMLLPEAFSTVAGGVHLVSVPNGVHSSAPPRVAEAFRMWIDHVEFGRPVSEIQGTELQQQGTEIAIAAQLREAAPPDAVRFFYITMDDDTYLGNAFWWSTPDDNYETATWQEIPMQQVGDRWEATLTTPSARYLAGLVDVSDHVDGKPGYVSSFVELWPLSGGTDAELCAAIAEDCRLDVAGRCRRFLERCLDGCVESFARCLTGHALDWCDDAVTAMCDDAVTGCLDEPCRAAYDQCVASDFSSCEELYGACLDPCELAIFEVATGGSDTALDYILDECGLAGGG